jgi:hypothetical protein
MIQLFEDAPAEADPWSVASVDDEPAQKAQAAAAGGGTSENEAEPVAEATIPKQPAQRSGVNTFGNPKGLVEPGNLDITNRPMVQNDDGTHSSEFSTSMQDDQGHEVLVPTVVNGKFLTPDGKKPPEGSDAEKAMFKKAWENYEQTGQHLGKFDSVANADTYAGQLHNHGPESLTQPAGAVGNVPAIPAPSQPSMQFPALGGVEPNAQPKEEGDFGPARGTQETIDGLKQLGQAWGDDYSFNSKDAKQGLTRSINGIMDAAGSTIVGGSGKGLVTFPEEVKGLRALIARGGPMAARALAGAVVGGYVSQKAARAIAVGLGLDPDSQDLAAALAGFAGGGVGGHTAAGGFHPSGEGEWGDHVRPEYRSDPWEVTEEEPLEGPKELTAGEKPAAKAEELPAPKTEPPKTVSANLLAPSRRERRHARCCKRAPACRASRLFFASPGLVDQVPANSASYTTTKPGCPSLQPVTLALQPTTEECDG